MSDTAVIICMCMFALLVILLYCFYLFKTGFIWRHCWIHCRFCLQRWFNTIQLGISVEFFVEISANIHFRQQKPTIPGTIDLPPSYNMVMNNSELFQKVETHEKPGTPPPCFQSQVTCRDPVPPAEILSNRSQFQQTVLTIS